MIRLLITISILRQINAPGYQIIFKIKSVSTHLNFHYSVNPSPSSNFVVDPLFIKV